MLRIFRIISRYSLKQKSMQVPVTRFHIYFQLFLLFVPAIMAAEEQKILHYSLYQETITINSLETGYTSAVYCRGRFSSHIGRETMIRYNELEAIGGLKARYRTGNHKYKDLGESEIHRSDAPEEAFDNGTSQYVISWPSKGEEDMDFLYTYKVNCKELMALSSIRINDVERTDTFDYTIRVPKGMQLYYRIPAGSDFIQTDSNSTEAGMIYHFRAYPKKEIVRAENLPDYAYPLYQPQNIRLILVRENEGNAWMRLNNWYLHFEESTSSLNETNKLLALKLKDTCTNADTITSRIFSYVQKHIFYSDRGGYLPHECNEVLKTRRGDCKDMSLLLVKLLSQCGLEANLALSSTLDYESDLDFPSLASANHMIAVAKIKNRYIYLDATDPVGRYGLPPVQVQDRKIFIITKDGGRLDSIPTPSGFDNRNRVSIHLTPSGNDLNGTIFSDYHGYSRHDADLARMISPLGYDSLLGKMICYESHETVIDNLKITKDDSLLTVMGGITVKYKVNVKDKMKTIKLNFLPFPHKYPVKLLPDLRLLTFQTVQNKMECEISFTKLVELKFFENVSFNSGGFHFELKVFQSSPKSIHLYYSFSYNGLEILPEQIQAYNDLNALIEKTLNSELSYSE
jgi:hypothetical protein